jgi:sporulation protein YlmC with PRC-barrel domain
MHLFWRGWHKYGSLNKETNMPSATVLTNDVISSDKVEGATVYNTAGEKLGSIDDLMIDKTSGQIRYAVLEFGGFLGIGTDRYPMPWNVLRYDTVKGGYTAPIDKAILDKAPKYREQEVPVYDSEYSRRVNAYYGNIP